MVKSEENSLFICLFIYFTLIKDEKKQKLLNVSPLNVCFS